MKSLVMTIGGLGLALAGCATGGGTGDGTGAPAQAGNICLNEYQITSFSPIGDSHLYVDGIGDRHYLFTMERGCFGLRSANTIGFPDNIGTLCVGRSDYVIYRDIATGIERCRILGIEAVASSEDARAIAEQREELRRESN